MGSQTGSQPILFSITLILSHTRGWNSKQMYTHQLFALYYGEKASHYRSHLTIVNTVYISNKNNGSFQLLNLFCSVMFDKSTVQHMMSHEIIIAKNKQLQG